MNRRTLKTLLTSLFVYGSCIAVMNTAAGGVNIVYNDMLAEVSNGSSYQTDNFDSGGLTIPLNELIRAESDGFYSQVLVDYSIAGNAVTLSNTIRQSRDGSQDSYVQANSFSTIFQVTTDSTYDLSGFYQVFDLPDSNGATTPGIVFLDMQFTFVDSTLGYGELFMNVQESHGTLNQNFVLGQQDGDNANYLHGSLTGLLVPGRWYQWYWQIYSYAGYGDDGGTNVTGDMTLKIQAAAPVPEPASGCLFAVGAAGLVFLHRRRRTELPDGV